MHINPFLPLNGDLSGNLINPLLNASARIGGMSIGNRGGFAGFGNSGIAIESKVFGGRSFGSIAGFDDSSNVIGSKVLSNRGFGSISLIGNESIFARAFSSRQIVDYSILNQDNDDFILQGRSFRERIQETKMPVQWTMNKQSVDTAEVMTIPSGYSIVLAGEFTNNGTVINSGVRMML